MKVSLNWLKEFVDIDLTMDELVTKIGAQLGAVEEVIDLSQKYQGIIVAKVISCEKHPDADKLNVCMIDDSGKATAVERNKDGLVQVVCGAPNVRAGLTVAWLPPGATVPNSVDKEPFVLEAREIRGVISNGMLASLHELAISDDHSGIAELSFGEAGDDFAKVVGLDDQIIDIENKMFTHRPDCFGILGVAREIAGITGKKFTSPNWYKLIQADKPGAKNTLLKVENKASDKVPRFVAQQVEGVEVKPSPVWMQSYLVRSGVRPINNLVDVTNYVMCLTAQPMHAYDADKLRKVSGGDTVKLEARMSKKGDKLTLLNGKEVTFDDDQTILITSADVPVGIAGVMGGADTEVDENTKNIVLECAAFDMYSIRKASMKYGVFSDAVTRFNKGQTPLQNAAVLQKSIGWITQLAGGQAGAYVDESNDLKPMAPVRVTTQFINDRLGFELTADEMQQLLENVEIEVERTDNKDELKVHPPFWRTDLEIPEDIVEEIGRLYGFDHLPLALPRRDITPAALNPGLAIKQRIRETLAKAGANELLTYNFVHGNLLQKAGQNSDDAFELSNALSPDLQFYRLSLLPSLLDKVHPNSKAGYETFALFEIGKSHAKQIEDDEKLPKEWEGVALVYASNAKLHPSAGAPYYIAQKYLRTLLDSLGIEYTIEPVNFEPTYLMDQIQAAPFDPKRMACVRINNSIAGFVGEFKASVRKQFKLPAYSAGFDMSLYKFEDQAVSSYHPLSKYPKVTQDITLKVPSETSYMEVRNFIWDNLDWPEHSQPQLESLDIYQGEDTSTKNMTFRFTIASFEKTMTDTEVNALLDAVAEKAKAKLNAERI